ncbi:Protein of unknown function (DUF3435) domain containing protein [Elaphomyces granulatus]
MGIAVVERYWRRYCAHLNEDYMTFLLSEGQAIYMNFFDWMYKTSKEKTSTGEGSASILPSSPGEWSMDQFMSSCDAYVGRLVLFRHLVGRRMLNQFCFPIVSGTGLPCGNKVSRHAKKKSTLDVDDFSVLLHHHWVYSSFFRHGSMVIQQCDQALDLWSAITGTRPGVRGVATNPGPSNTNTAKGGTRKRKQDESFKSDLPQPISFDDLPHTVCYRDVELFYLKNTGGRDILCAIIEFRNLKGRPEGADGTKFFMHGDYQLVYCPITYIVSLAFRDEAFENDALTPESIWRLKVPKRNRALPLRWKEVVDRPLLRRFVRTPYGYEVHPTLPMTYDS